MQTKNLGFEYHFCLLGHIVVGFFFQGDYDPTKVKVLHMPMNPGAILQKQRAEEVARLRKENEALSQRVKLLEEGGGAVEDLTVKVQQKLEQPGTSDDIEGKGTYILIFPGLYQ